ncbi:MAG: tryptophan halogenase [Caulobacter sp.]|nr:tryptophan halogenase [Caulobacter sp.]
MSQRIVIVGGGTAGWLTAAYLAKTLRADQQGGAQITLIESPEIGIIGVGEGTFPTIRATLAALGVSEARFLRESSSTFKQGVHFVDWAQAGTDYFHPFNLPFTADGKDLSPYWLLGGRNEPFADAVTIQGGVVQAGRGPKRLSDPDFQGPMNYAYHFDAARFADFLRGVGVEAGVTHRLGKVEGVHRGEDGDITHLSAGELGDIAGDLFIDCSGFRARLIGEAMGAPFRAVDDVLFNDRALAVQVPYADPEAPIVPATVATAHEAGWTWDIGLRERRGTGYVFSSRHTDEARAETVLRGYLGPEADHLPTRLLKFQTGYRQQQWIGNCVAVGLSAGFFEPLESTGIMLIEVAAALIGEAYPFGDRGARAAAARNFNGLMIGRYERVVDFLKLHYCLSRRPEPYWRDNVATIPESLADKLAQWRRRPVSSFDFIGDLETFLPASYQYIFHGMGGQADLSETVGLYPEAARAMAAKAFGQVRAAGAEALKHLPAHRALVEAYYARAG